MLLSLKGLSWSLNPDEVFFPLSFEPLWCSGPFIECGLPCAIGCMLFDLCTQQDIPFPYMLSFHLRTLKPTHQPLILNTSISENASCPLWLFLQFLQRELWTGFLDPDCPVTPHSAVVWLLSPSITSVKSLLLWCFFYLSCPLSGWTHSPSSLM